MCALLEDGLADGALGMSSNLMDHDGDGRRIPTLLADEAEWTALFDVIARHPAATLQVLVDTFIHLTAPKTIPWLVDLIGDRKIRVQFAGGVPTLRFQGEMVAPLLELHERFKREGKDVWPGYAHIPVTAILNIDRSLLFAQSDEFVWHEVVAKRTPAEKEALLRDPDWRARARASWDTKAHRHSHFADARRLIFLDSENGAGPVKLTAADYAATLGVHPSDAMAEWFLRNGLGSTVHLAPFEMIDEMVLRMLRDPQSVGNLSDAPAHGQMFCGGGENMILFSYWVKEKQAIRLEEAVHVQTGKLARYFNLRDLGEIAVGRRADVTVFRLDEIERREMEKVVDVPDGRGGRTWRWTRKPAPVRLTLCNGEPTFERGAFTGNLPGVMVSPALAR
jgi:N-acyl-D-aspartate/D-glutamate deacylase